MEKNDTLYPQFEATQTIAALPNILMVVCKTTEMCFAAINRVTDKRSVAFAVRDEGNFGIKAGDELRVETNVCLEIRNSRMPVIINNIAEDRIYQKLITPNFHHFQSYISAPIFLKSGDFFGTIFSFDKKPKEINNVKIIGMMGLFADLIAFHLHEINAV